MSQVTLDSDSSASICIDTIKVKWKVQLKTQEFQRQKVSSGESIPYTSNANHFRLQAL